MQRYKNAKKLLRPKWELKLIKRIGLLRSMHKSWVSDDQTNNRYFQVIDVKFLAN